MAPWHAGWLVADQISVVLGHLLVQEEIQPVPHAFRSVYQGCIKQMLLHHNNLMEHVKLISLAEKYLGFLYVLPEILYFDR